MLEPALLIILAAALATAACAAGTSGTSAISFNDSVPSDKLDVQAGSVGTWTVTYTAGPAGVAVGGGIEIWRVPAKFWLGQCLQSTDPKLPDYVTCRLTGNGALDLAFVAGFYKETCFARVLVKDAPLAPGEQILINFGDRTGGSPGAVVPPSTQYDMEFYVRADVNRSGRFEKLARSMTVNCVPGPAVRAVLTAPSIVRKGERFRLHVRIEDANSNLCRGFTGELELSCSDPSASLPAKVAFTAADEGHREVQADLSNPGDSYFSASATGITGRSNPCRCAAQPPERRIYWGDIHNHTEESDGTGTVKQTLSYARDVVALDFCSVTDHLSPKPDGGIVMDPQSPHGKLGVTEWWKHQQTAARDFDAPGKFVTVLGYEWTEGTTVGGDRNIYFENLSSNLICLADLKAQFEAIRKDQHRQVLIPHVGGRVASWDLHDQKVEPVLEINSMHGHFEWFAQEALSRGYRLGFTGGSDGHLGLPGNDIWPLHGRAGLARRDYGVPSGITAVYATELTREAVLNALFERRTYATTGARILLDFSMDGHHMGSEYSSRKEPTMRITVDGTAPIERVEVIRNDKRLIDRHASGQSADLTLTDHTPTGGTSYYYVRVTQQDGEIAWSSPIWLTFRGKAVRDTRKLDAWNVEDSIPARPSTDHDYTPDLLKHLAWRAPGRFSDVKQVRIVRNERGSYALFYCRDSKWNGEPAHIRWYIGFPDERIRVDRGQRDFGVAPD